MSEESESKTLKPFVANLIIFFVEIIILAIYFTIGFGSISNGVKNQDLVGMFDGVITAIWFLNIAILILAILIFSVKSLRTKTNVRWAIWDIIWVAFNIYSMCF